MNNSMQAQLNHAYNKFQWLMDQLAYMNMQGFDDMFIAAYDNKDVLGCKRALGHLSDLVNDIEYSKHG